MIDDLKQKAFEDFKTNCWNGIEIYERIETFHGDYADERALMVIAHSYFNAKGICTQVDPLCKSFNY
jgi:hypothetical protein